MRHDYRIYDPTLSMSETLARFARAVDAKQQRAKIGLPVATVATPWTEADFKQAELDAWCGRRIAGIRPRPVPRTYARPLVRVRRMARVRRSTVRRARRAAARRAAASDRGPSGSSDPPPHHRVAPPFQVGAFFAPANRGAL